VHVTAQPSHDRFGEIARHGTDTYTGHTVACLVAADRYHHLATQIRPQLAAGRIVLCDRYVASSYVLQRVDQCRSSSSKRSTPQSTSRTSP
jgi:dTMP kinase